MKFVATKIGDYIIGDELLGQVISSDQHTITWECLKDSRNVFKIGSINTNTSSTILYLLQIIPKEVYESPLYQLMQEK